MNVIAAESGYSAEPRDDLVLAERVHVEEVLKFDNLETHSESQIESRKKLLVL